MAAGKPRPESRAPNLKRRKPRTRRPDCFSEKYRRLMEVMGQSEEGPGAGGTGSPGERRGQGGPESPQKSPRHPDSYSVKFRTLMAVMEQRAGPSGGNVAAATSAIEAKAVDGGPGEAERERDGRGELEKGGSEGPTPHRNEGEEEEEEHDNSAELDWMAAMVEALIDGELHQSQVREPEGVCPATPTTQPAPVVDDVLPGPIAAERQSPGAWSGFGATSDLDYTLLEEILRGPPLSLGQNLDLGLDPLGDLSLSEWSFLTDGS